MTVVVLLVLCWAAVSLVLAVLIGRALHLSEALDQRERRHRRAA